MKPAAIVLAGGAARRFGGDKLAADLAGRPILAHAVSAVAAFCDPVILVLGPESPVPDLGAPVVIARDTEAFGGPLAGLLAGLETLAALPGDPSDVALLVGGDMPSMVGAVLERMIAVLAADPVLGAVTLESDPPSALPMAVRPSLALPAVRRLIDADRRRLRGLLAAVPAAEVAALDWRALDPDGRTLRDVDVPADLP